MAQGRIQAEYERTNPRSKALAGQARQVIPGGITHDIRYLRPFPIAVDRAKGTRKWTVDGQELIDYWMGHGSLFLGHGCPAIVAAVHAQLDRGTHYGGCHELEVRWAESVQDLVPSAQRVRFTASGTEATHLALRVARAFTGRPKIVKLEGHFHGWHDGVQAAVKPPYEAPSSAGIPGEALGQIVLCPPNNLAALEALLSERRDVAAVILEPGGGASGTIPTQIGYLRGLREATQRHQVLLIFDEVITGFRYSPGGVQGLTGVVPDITALAKILAGGLPGGAVAGRADVLDRLAFNDDPTWNRQYKVAHAGTFNANPLSAAAGVAMLSEIRDGQAHARADRAAARLRAGLSEAWKRVGAPGCVYGESSIFNWTLEPALTGGPKSDTPPRGLQAMANPAAYHAMRCALILNGVDVCPLHGWVSAEHSEADVDRTVQAFEKALTLLKEDGLFA